MHGSITQLDASIVAAYVIIVIGTGLFFSRRKGSAAEYFLAGRRVGWIALGASLFSSSVSSEHFLGVASVASTSGLAAGSYEFLALLAVLLLSWIFVPMFLRSGVITTPEFLEQRFSSPARWYLSSASIIGYFFLRIFVPLSAGVTILYVITGWDITWCAIGIVLVTGLYTLIGGLAPVVYTNFIQAGTIIVGALALARVGLRESGGMRALAANTPADLLHLFKPLADPDFPWIGVLLGAPILGVWYWCTDQYVVQRIFSAKSEVTARAGVILAGLMKLGTVLVLLLIGIIAVRLSGENVSGDRIYSWMALTFLPRGIRGIVIAGLLAGLMASMSNAFHSIATLVTMDFVKPFHRGADEKKLIKIGRSATVISLGVVLIFVPFLEIFRGEQLYLQLLKVQAYFAPPIVACFLFGVFRKQSRNKGAIVTLICGLVLGVLKFGLELQSRSAPFTNDALNFIASINFLNFAAFLFLSSVGILLAMNHLTKPASQR